VILSQLVRGKGIHHRNTLAVLHAILNAPAGQCVRNVTLRHSPPLSTLTGAS
jgi:hypothetical protein